MKYLILFGFAFLLGCGYTYHRDRSVLSGDCDGYRDKQLDSTSYLITMCGGYFYEEADLYVLYRAAELTVANKKRYFVVIDNPVTHASIRAAKRIRILQDTATDTMTAFNAESLLVSLAPYIAWK
jgi:hypothetical protein